MTKQIPFDLPPPVKVLSDQLHLITDKLEQLMPLLDLLSTSLNPETEEARQDLAMVLAAVLERTTSISQRQEAVEARLIAMDARLIAMEEILTQIASFARRMNQRLP